MSYTPQDKRDEKLLDAISKYQSLPQQQQDVLRPQLDEAIARHIEISKYHKTIDDFLQLYDINLEIKRAKE